MKNDLEREKIESAINSQSVMLSNRINMLNIFMNKYSILITWVINRIGYYRQKKDNLTTVEVPYLLYIILMDKPMGYRPWRIDKDIQELILSFGKTGNAAPLFDSVVISKQNKMIKFRLNKEYLYLVDNLSNSGNFMSYELGQVRGLNQSGQALFGLLMASSHKYELSISRENMYRLLDLKESVRVSYVNTRIQELIAQLNTTFLGLSMSHLLAGNKHTGFTFTWGATWHLSIENRADHVPVVDKDNFKWTGSSLISTHTSIETTVPLDGQASSSEIELEDWFSELLNKGENDYDK